MSTELAHSSFLDLNSYRSKALLPTDGTPATSVTLNVALVFEPATDPTSLLNLNWAARNKQIDALTQSDTLWSTYGAHQHHYDQVQAALGGMGIQTFDQAHARHGYVSSAESRTLWVQLNETSFESLFGTKLMQGHDAVHNFTYFWQGNLSLPDGWHSTLGVKGLWFNSYEFKQVPTIEAGHSTYKIPTGSLSPGNDASNGGVALYPQVIADHYNFPLKGDLRNPASGSVVTTGAIGFVEPSIGTAVPGNVDFQTAIDTYRQLVGITTAATVVSVHDGGQFYTDDSGGERSLDVGIVTAINPQSPLVLYAGSGQADGAKSDAFTAYQSAIWDQTNNVNVISSSWGFNYLQMAPGSPFIYAAQHLFMDAALRKITVLTANSDGGSGDGFGNGLTNTMNGQTSPYGILVGGTSLSTMHEAGLDTTLHAIVDGALRGDRQTLWDLVAGGLTKLPTVQDPAAPLIETVWNMYKVKADGTGFVADSGFFENDAGTGGVDPTQPVPWYQQPFADMLVTPDQAHLPGRGTPDVTAQAGGNMYYTVPGADMTGTMSDSGTSASTPFWAALISQFNAIFQDQGLPVLGYANDLLYIAAAIAPASFNDVTVGNNISSFTLGGDGGLHAGKHHVTPTGNGYTAGPGYDLTSGLGSPNGVLLARALTAVGHSQWSFDTAAYPDILDFTASAWIGGADQGLLFQTMVGSQATIGLDVGSTDASFVSRGTQSYAWTPRFAGQALQEDFDPALVKLFDKQAQGHVGALSATSGDTLSITINGASTLSMTGSLTSDFGFVDFQNTAGTVRVARAVAVAETASGASDQTAVVRLRQGGEDSVSISFYRVDDYTGAINGLHAGDAGYAEQAAQRAYTLSHGHTSVAGPGYGNYRQTELTNVDAGDLIAMVLTHTATNQKFWGFAGGNETAAGVKVGHLWNYELNTWGWEDTKGGGDSDYNDLVVQIDFTSTAGHQWLV